MMHKYLLYLLSRLDQNTAICKIPVPNFLLASARCTIEAIKENVRNISGFYTNIYLTKNLIRKDLTSSKRNMLYEKP